jgi:hypothetical protein
MIWLLSRARGRTLWCRAFPPTPARDASIGQQPAGVLLQHFINPGADDKPVLQCKHHREDRPSSWVAIGLQTSVKLQAVYPRCFYRRLHEYVELFGTVQTPRRCLYRDGPRAATASLSDEAHAACRSGPMPRKSGEITRGEIPCGIVVCVSRKDQPALGTSRRQSDGMLGRSTSPSQYPSISLSLQDKLIRRRAQSHRRMGLMHQRLVLVTRVAIPAAAERDGYFDGWRCSWAGTLAGRPIRFVTA